MGDFTYTLPANTFLAATKAEANAIATAYANKQAVLVKFCCDTPVVRCCQNAAVDTSITISGGQAPFTWAIQAGAIPAGLSLGFPYEGRVMTIQGSPTVIGTDVLTFTITDASGTAIEQLVSITVEGIDNASLPDGQTGSPYSQQITASGGSGTYSFTVTGSLPAGLLMSPTGLIHGTPTGSGTSSFQVCVVDSEVWPPILGAASNVLALTGRASAAQTAHVYAIRDYLSIFANPPPEIDTPAPHFTLWTGTLTSSLGRFDHDATGSRFPNDMYGPRVTLVTVPPLTLTIIPTAVTSWILTVEGWSIAAGAMLTIWQGQYTTTKTHPDGVYLRTGGLMGSPSSITVDFVS